MGSEKQATNNPLEQFVLLSKGAKGAAAVELVKQVLETPGIYVFGELLDMPNIQELATSHPKYHTLLNIFAFGTYADYKANKEELPELTPPMEKKLKHLTIVTLATKNKCISYDTLLKELEMKSLRELEDVIIEVIYADIIHGKLDQQEHQLEVDYAIGRDIRPDAITEILNVLSSWCTGCEAVLGGIETQITSANTYLEKQNGIKLQTEQEVNNIKKTLKTSQQTESDEQMVTDSRECAAADKPVKKATKAKGIRGSGKFWGKSS